MAGLQLFRFLPEIIRIRDSLDSSSDGVSKGNLEKVFEALDDTINETCTEIEELADIIDLDVSDPKYLIPISLMLGMPIGEEFDDKFRRWLISSLIYFYKGKGTHGSNRKQFLWLEEEKWQLWELWKTIPNEVCDYSRTRDYGHTIKAARYDIYKNVGGAPSFLTPSEGVLLDPLIRDVVPIHVLLRLNCEEVDIAESFPIIKDDQTGSRIVGIFEENAVFGVDEIDFTPTCVSSCQAACQASSVQVVPAPSPGPGVGPITPFLMEEALAASPSFTNVLEQNILSSPITKQKIGFNPQSPPEMFLAQVAEIKQGESGDEDAMLVYVDILWPLREALSGIEGEAPGTASFVFPTTGEPNPAPSKDPDLDPTKWADMSFERKAFGAASVPLGLPVGPVASNIPEWTYHQILRFQRVSEGGDTYTIRPRYAITAATTPASIFTHRLSEKLHPSLSTGDYVVVRMFDGGAGIGLEELAATPPTSDPATANVKLQIGTGDGTTVSYSESSAGKPIPFSVFFSVEDVDGNILKVAIPDALGKVDASVSDVDTATTSDKISFVVYVDSPTLPNGVADTEGQGTAVGRYRVRWDTAPEVGQKVFINFHHQKDPLRDFFFFWTDVPHSMFDRWWSGA